MKRAAIYVRVSTQEQKDHGLSVDSQIVALREYCDDNGYYIMGTYNDAGISARKRYTKRPALLRLLEDCRAGKVDVILFTKLDRWFRSVGDYYEVQRVLDEAKVPWRAIWEDYETETSSGVFKVNIMLSVAQSEADRTSERIKAIMAYKRAKGDYLGIAARGYKKVNNRLVIDEEAAPEIRQMFDIFMNALTVNATKQELARRGYVSSYNAIRLRLRNPVYTGRYEGGTCPAYITEEEHAFICDQISRRRYERKAGHDRQYVFTGILRCGYCQKNMHPNANFSSSRVGKENYRYTCDARNKSPNHPYLSVSEPRIEKFLLNEFESLVANHNMKVRSNPKLSDYEKEAHNLKAQLERVGVRFEVGDISIEEYKTKREKLLQQIAALENNSKPSLPIEIPENWREIYGQLDRRHKRAFWASFIDKVEYTNDTKDHPKVILLEAR